MFSDFFRKSCGLSDNVEKYDGSREDVKIWRLRVAYWISKATRTQVNTRTRAHTPIHTQTDGRTHTRTHTQKHVILIFHCSNGYVNAP
jgi:hypothetical protein